MPTVKGKLNSIVNNTRKLIELCETLQRENDALKLDNQSLNVALTTSKTQNQQLEEKVKALTVAKALDVSEPQDGILNEKVLDTKRKINDFVREIDRCIELLK
jgi:SMC interacting uncharacterized protein involved in chromosome segregation